MILSEDVRYSLRYRDGKLTPADILSVMNTPQFEDMGLYLTMKLFDKDPNQAQLLSDVTTTCLQGKDMKDVIRYYLKSNCHSQKTVAGRKVGLISRRGPDAFNEAFGRIAQETLTQSTPVLLSYAGLIGMRHFLNHAQIEQSIGIILTDQSLESCQVQGYSLTIQEDRSCGLYSINELLCMRANITLVDDTESTGETMQGVQQVLAGQFPHLMMQKKTASMVI